MNAPGTARPPGKIGIWSLELRFGDPALAAEAAAELDRLGYGAIWIPGGMGGELSADIDRLLAAAARITIASGVLNVWMHEPEGIAAWWQGLPREHQARVLLGIGVSHAHVVGENWGKPLAVMRNYLERLGAAGLPAASLCLAALGPRMLALARTHTAGAHPYLVTPEHTARARAVLGPDKLLAPEQGVVLERDPERARDLARNALSRYLQFPNYRNNWLRLGFTAQDIDGASDRLIDALFAWGSPERIAERVEAHIAAGADHVCLQVITGAGLDIGAARAAWRELAAVLL